MSTFRGNGQHQRLPRRSSLLARCFCVCALPLFLQLGLELTQEAFCEAALRSSSRPLRSSLAREAQAKDNPVKELQQKLTELLGRNLTRQDLVWRYEASLELPCLENFSTGMVGPVVFKGATSDKCRRKAASAVLASLKAQTESDAEPAEQKGASKLQIGDEVEGRVIGRYPRGLRLKVAGKQAILPANEISDGFPDVVPKRGSKVQVRVLQTGNPLKVTGREGSLERKDFEGVKVDLKVLKDLPDSDKVEAEVLTYDFYTAFLKIVSPSDPNKATLADLPRYYFIEGAEKEVRIGSKVQVRKKYAQRGRAIVTMRDLPTKRPEDISVGDTLSGTVISVLRGQRPAIFLDVGVEQAAYMDWQECGDGHNRSSFDELTRGRSTTVRVLKVNGDRLYVTRRSGDLYRATLAGVGKPKNTAEVMSKFMSLPADQDLEGEVFRLYPTHAVIAVKSQDGDSADGYLARPYFSEAFSKEAAPGLTVRVRRLPEQNATGPHLMVTMRDPGDFSKEDDGESSVEEEPMDQDEEDEEALESEPSAEDVPSAPESNAGPLDGLKDFLMR